MKFRRWLVSIGGDLSPVIFVSWLQPSAGCMSHCDFVTISMWWSFRKSAKTRQESDLFVCFWPFCHLALFRILLPSLKWLWDWCTHFGVMDLRKDGRKLTVWGIFWPPSNSSPSDSAYCLDALRIRPYSHNCQLVLGQSQYSLSNKGDPTKHETCTINVLSIQVFSKSFRQPSVDKYVPFTSLPWVTFAPLYWTWVWITGRLKWAFTSSTRYAWEIPLKT